MNKIPLILVFLGAVSTGLAELTLPFPLNNISLSSGFFDGSSISFALLNNIVTLRIGDSQFQVGTAAFPFDGLCKSSIKLVRQVACEICYHDCRDNHGAYAGSCAVPEGGNGTQYCVCAPTPEQARARNIDLSSGATTCGISGSSFFKNAIDALFLNLVRTNMYLKQCTPLLNDQDTSNCNADCISSHAAASGNCTKGRPPYDSQYYVENYIPGSAGEYPFCTCYGNPNVIIPSSSSSSRPSSSYSSLLPL